MTYTPILLYTGPERPIARFAPTIGDRIKYNIIYTRSDEVLDLRVFAAHVVADVDQFDGAVWLVPFHRLEFADADERVERLVERQRVRRLHFVLSHRRVLGS